MTTTLAFRPLSTWTLWIELRLEGVPMHAEPVTRADLEDLRAECLWEARARRGDLSAPSDDLDPRMAAIALDDERGPEDGCGGLLLEASDPAGARVRCIASSRAFDPVAERALAAWLAAGSSADDAAGADFHLCAVPGAGPAEPAPDPLATSSVDGLRVGTPTPRAFEALVRPLAPLLEGAQQVGEPSDLFPVLITRAARRGAERASRRGARRTPPVESGALLLGYLGSCPESGEAFAVVTEALPADEDGTTFSLAIPPSTWREARARCDARPGLRVLGQAHGHNFKPQDVEGGRCARCPATAECACDSAFLSSEDRLWARAVFHAQPWQLGQVFGLDAAGQRRDAFFGQRGARLVPRDYFLLDSFDPPPFDPPHFDTGATR